MRVLVINPLWTEQCNAVRTFLLCMRRKNVLPEKVVYLIATEYIPDDCVFKYAFKDESKLEQFIRSPFQWIAGFFF